MVVALKRNQYRSKTAACPFYKKEDRQMIFCYGVIENSSLHLAFGNDTDCKEYKVTNCRKDFYQCPVYKMLEEMYDG